MSEQIAYPTWRGCDALYFARKLGLSTGLQLALDAGASESYTSGQSWLDRSGNGYDFFLGADGSATSTDPTFNGTAGGLSSAEFFSFDAGDYFTYDTTNETWMQNLHKDNAKFCMAFWIQFGALGSIQGIAGTGSGSIGTNVGIVFRVLTGNNLSYLVRAAGSTSLSVTSTVTISEDVWAFVVLYVDEATGTGYFIVNDTVESFTSTYSSPSAASASFGLQFGTQGNGDTPLTATSRMAMVWAWEGTVPTLGSLSALRAASRQRFGI